MAECQSRLLQFDKEQFITLNTLINSYNILSLQNFDLLTCESASQSGGLNNFSGKKSQDFNTPLENKNKKLLKRYNTDNILNVFKSNTKVSNLNHINVIESGDFGYSKRNEILLQSSANNERKDSSNVYIIKEFSHLDASPEKISENMKEIEETEPTFVEKKSPLKIYYNINQPKLPLNTSLNLEQGSSTKKPNVLILIIIVRNQQDLKSDNSF